MPQYAARIVYSMYFPWFINHSLLRIYLLLCDVQHPAMTEPHFPPQGKLNAPMQKQLLPFPVYLNGA